ncbi:MAG: hypothetical protein ABEJ97_05330 [Halobellus sp.]
MNVVDGGVHRAKITEKHSVLWCHTPRVPKIIVDVGEPLKEQMEQYPDVEWDEVSRRAIRERLETLELVEEATVDADLSDADAAELAERIDEIAERRIREASD